jgi:hypothetical protein
MILAIPPNPGQGLQDEIDRIKVIRRKDSVVVKRN